MRISIYSGYPFRRTVQLKHDGEVQDLEGAKAWSRVVDRRTGKELACVDGELNEDSDAFEIDYGDTSDWPETVAESSVTIQLPDSDPMPSETFQIHVLTNPTRADGCNNG